QSVRTGSLGASHGAPTAMTTKSSTISAPTSAAGRRRPTRQARASRPDRGAEASAPMGSEYAGVAVLSGIGRAANADAGVQHGVGDVDQQVYQHVRRRGDRH